MNHAILMPPLYLPAMRLRFREVAERALSAGFALMSQQMAVVASQHVR